MMPLAEILNRTREAAETKRPPETVVQMHRAVDELRASGILNRVLKAGDPMPAFRLEGQSRRIVDSGELLNQGPLVVTFYRGKW
jgi:hypothetical protein